MPAPDPEKLASLLLGTDPVYGLETDYLIRKAGNGMSATAFFQTLRRLDEASETFQADLQALCEPLAHGDPSVLISFDDGRWDHLPPAPEGEDDEEWPEDGPRYFLRLLFESSEAAFYLNYYVPDLSVPYILGASRKLQGAEQILSITLADAKYLHVFLDQLKACQFLEGIEELTAEEFQAAMRRHARLSGTEEPPP
jgi:hypothetical protein